MIFDIVTYPNEILRASCSTVTEFNKELKKFCKDMIKTMKANNGLGLAAPQVGRDIRVIAFQDQKTLVDSVMINPVIKNVSKITSLLQEGCLSIPDTLVYVVRHEEITVEFTTIKGKRQQKKFTGMNARILQHEIDHLNGKLIIDY